jgi:L-aspartate oxidase
MGVRAAEEMNGVLPVRGSVASGFAPTPGPGTEIAAVRTIVSAHLGVLRDGNGLRTALSRLLPLMDVAQPASPPAAVALLMAVFAMQRAETRGAHARADFPQRSTQARRQRMTLAAAVEAAHLIVSEPALRSA